MISKEEVREYLQKGFPEPDLENPNTIAIYLLNNRVDGLQQELGMVIAKHTTEIRALQDLIIERTQPRTPVVKKTESKGVTL